MSSNIQDLKIKNLQPGEEVKIVLQRHWFALIGTFGYLFFLALSVLIMIYFGSSIPLIGPIINIVLVVYISVFLLFIYINWMRYELDLYIVTTKRIIGLEEVSFLNRHLSECALERVQEVNAKTTGFFSNMLNFGEVTIHTASETSDFNMVYMPDAFENARSISNLIAEYKTPKVIDTGL
ncbi:MAG: PH domain-containing protein [Candidatus Gracilibacteria bacterium]|nr:PH domain-containing protein [Candidatus Gracilibacteria bacterium]MDD2908833.1 PH domain-containing protein [Candidatus Gracilibacteria bacterium]